MGAKGIMGHIIHTDKVGNQRRQQRRAIAEALRRLKSKQVMDEESKDLAALIVFSLRALEETADRTATAWEKRNYYLKADRFRRQWEWLAPAADNITDLLKREDWNQLAPALAALLPYFSDIRVARYTRPPSLWQGCYSRLADEWSADG